MAELSFKDMTTKFTKLEKFQGVDFRRWQKKMHFLLTTLNVVHVLSSPVPEEKGDDVCSLIPESFYVQDDDAAWWVDSEATSHICRDRRCFQSMMDPL